MIFNVILYKATSLNSLEADLFCYILSENDCGLKDKRQKLVSIALKNFGEEGKNQSSERTF